MRTNLIFLITASVFITSCKETPDKTVAVQPINDSIIKPVIITDSVKYDTDDPAIWINPLDPSQSLVIGTDKEEDGALYVFDLQGKVIEEKVVRGLKRPNNVDIEYGLMLGGKVTDIAVVTERLTSKIRIYSLPDMRPVDNGGIEVFTGESGEEFRALMGVGIYRNKTGEIYAIVGRKNGPTDGTYLWQYKLQDDGTGMVKARLVRKFGVFSGKKEIESIAVDDQLGYVYYSDEGYGIRKYYAEPSKGNSELAIIGEGQFRQDCEGISIYNTSDSTGYILVSDQQTNFFKVFPREGSNSNPHDHPLIKSLHLSTLASDGSDVVAVPLNKQFAKGLFVAMSADRTYQYYRWDDLMP